MSHTMTHKRAASREHSRVGEHGVLTSGLRQGDARIEVDEMRMRSRSRQTGGTGLVHTVRIVTGGTRGAGRQMSAVAASRGRGPQRLLRETGVTQDDAPVMAAVAERVDVVTFRRVVRHVVALPQNRYERRTVGAA